MKFLSRGGGLNLFLTADEAVMVLGEPSGGRTGARPSGSRSDRRKASQAGSVVRMKLVGAAQRPRINGVGEQGRKSNYFIGNDPKNWRTSIQNYGGVKYEGVYPGIDAVFYGNQRRLEYDFVVAPGADPSAVRLRFEGARKMYIDADGDLRLKVGAGELRQHKPRVYQEVAGGRREVAGRYVMAGRNEVRFEIGAYDFGRPLVIDPVISYSTYLGGSNSTDIGVNIAVDSSGNAYITGTTESTNFPLKTPLSGQNVVRGLDAFVTKLNAAGNALVYSTYLGGTDNENDCCGYPNQKGGIAVDSSGNAYVTGETKSPDFPTLNALQGSLNGYNDAFVAKLNAAGNALVYSTYLGGSEREAAFGVAVDSAGSAYVTGESDSTNFPVTGGAFQTAKGNWDDVFVAKLAASGSSLAYSTFLGGAGGENAYDIALDSSNNAYVTGRSGSLDFPVTAGAFQTTRAGGTDAFLTKLNATGSGLVYSTYFGGSDSDEAYGLALDAAGNAYAAGWTASPNFPTLNPIQAALSGRFDAFVTKFDPAGAALVYSTYLGGSSWERANGVGVDAAGNAYITGYTLSLNFPVVNALQQIKYNAENITEGFVAKLNAAGNALAYSTYLSGTIDGEGMGVAVDAAGNAYFTGWTWAYDFPTITAYQANKGGYNIEGFVTKISSADGHAVTGNVTDSNGVGISGARMRITGAVTGSVPVAPNGTYTFVAVPGNTYTLTPQKSGVTFSPASRTFNAVSAPQTADFVEVKHVISGRVARADGVRLYEMTMTLTSGASTRTTLTDLSGNYSFDVAPGANYTVTPPAGTGYTFSPASRTFNALNGDQTANFTGHTGPTFAISGRAADGSGAALGNVTVTLSGSASATTQTDALGNYTLTAAAGGSYTVRAARVGYAFSPGAHDFNNLGANQTADFTGAVVYDIAGRVADAGGSGIAGVTVTLSGSQSDVSAAAALAGLARTAKPSFAQNVAPSASFKPILAVLTDVNGNYSFAGLASGGDYLVAPSKVGWTFAPWNRFYGALSAGQTADFTATATGLVALPPVADAYVQDGANAAVNFGAATSLDVRTDTAGNNRDAYFKFDLSRVNTVGSVRLRINAALSAAGSLVTSVHSVADTSWAEAGINWNNKPPRGATELGRATVTSTAYGWYDFDVTAYLKAEKAAGRHVVSLALHNPNTSTTKINLKSKEAAADQPELLIAPHAIAGVAPAAGTVGTSVTITGAGFGALQGASTVTFNGAPATPTSWGDTAIVAKVPASATTGPVVVTVGGAASNGVAFTVTPVGTTTTTLNPTADSHVRDGTNANTNFGTAALLEVLTTGTVNDNRDAYLKYDLASITGSISSAKLRLNASLSAAGTVTYSVHSVATTTWIESGTGGITWTNKPARGASLGTKAVTGTAYAWYEMDITAYVRDEKVAGRNVVSFALHNAANSTPFVRVNSRQAASNKPELVVVTTPAPAVANLSPASGAADTVVTINGSNFGATQGTSTVTFNGAPAAATSWNASQIRASVPASATTGPVVVTVGEMASNGVTFTVTTAPVVGSLSPAAGAPGTPVRIDGLNFGATQGTSTVTFNGAAATPASWSAASITAPVPAGATTGPVVVTVGGVASNGVAFAVTTKPALLVVGVAAPLGAGDAAIQTRLQSLGYAVTVVTGAAATAANAQGKHVVVVSSTVTPSDVNTKFRASLTPVVNCDEALMDDFGLTGTAASEFGTAGAQTLLSLVNAGHALAGGLSSGVTGVVTAASTFAWGRPNANAAAVATLADDATKTLIFGYETGASMPGLTAPARRAGFFLSDTTAAALSADGWALFDAVVNWAARPAPAVLGLSPAAGPVATSVTVTGANFGATQGTSTVTFNGTTAAPTSWGNASIMVPVPASATTGPVVVTVNGLASNGVAFTVGAADSDGDGLPDAWELQHFGNLAQTAAGDFDGDGLSNLTEHLQGRNPTKGFIFDTRSFVNLRLFTPLYW